MKDQTKALHLGVAGMLGLSSTSFAQSAVLKVLANSLLRTFQCLPMGPPRKQSLPTRLTHATGDPVPPWDLLLRGCLPEQPSGKGESMAEEADPARLFQ